MVSISQLRLTERCVAHTLSRRGTPAWHVCDGSGIVNSIGLTEFYFELATSAVVTQLEARRKITLMVSVRIVERMVAAECIHK